ncbi:rod-determining factor RdfA [Halorubrum trueperi]|uniref:Rod-determining factor RdfA n=1 Tax=Halorubrum trueperi TaxID=2004704 RepID=A0ABD5UL23_9EURY
MSDSAGARRSKVARLVDEHDLAGVGDELEARWTATGDDHWSLRDLAAEFNRELVGERLQAAGLRPSDSEIETIVQWLTGAEVGAAERTQLRRRLEREGVDVDALDRDVVTYQAIRSYLRDYRGAEYERASGDRTETVADAIQKLRGRLSSVAETKLEQLRETSHLSLGEFHVMVDVGVYCTECDSRYGIVQLLDAGGCDCGETDR